MSRAIVSAFRRRSMRATCWKVFTLTAWEAVVLPLNYARKTLISSTFLKHTPRLIRRLSVIPLIRQSAGSAGQIFKMGPFYRDFLVVQAGNG